MKMRTLAVSVLLSMLPLCGLIQAQITGVTAGTDLTGGGTSGNVTLNLDTTEVPRLATANTFTTNQTVKGNLSASGIVSGGSFQIGSNLWGYGSFANSNAYLGFAGNTVSVGTLNTATGYQALLEDTRGSGNTAYGASAMNLSSSGDYNTAVGVGSLMYNTGNGNSALGLNSGTGNTTGTNNTFVGSNSGASVDNLTNSSAIGGFATVGVSNALILGGTASSAVTVDVTHLCHASLCHASPRHASPVTHLHASPVTHLLSRISCHASPVTHLHASPVRISKVSRSDHSLITVKRILSLPSPLRQWPGPR